MAQIQREIEKLDYLLANQDKNPVAAETYDHLRNLKNEFEAANNRLQYALKKLSGAQHSLQHSEEVLQESRLK